MRARLVPMLMITALVALGAPAYAATDSEVSTASASGRTPQNHQNEPTVAIDQSRPDVVVSGRCARRR